MKRLIFAAMLFVAGMAYGQDTTAFSGGNFYADSLVTTHDTVDVVVTAMTKVQYFTVTAYTSTGTDTISVDCLTLNGATWVAHGLVDLSNNTDVTTAIVTTTPKEFLLLDVNPGKIRLRSLAYGRTQKITFIVAGKGVR